MKKIILLPLTASLLTGTLLSCSSKKESVQTESEVLISEYVESSSSSRAIELYNKSEKDISLDKYALNIYFKGSTTPSKTISLKGIIKAKSTYVITTSESDESIKNIASLVDDNLLFNGSQQIALAKGKKIIDLLGEMATTYDFASNVTLVRKKAHMDSKNVYDEYDWLRYNVDNFSYLGNSDNSVTEEELEKGPQIDTSYYEKSFIDPDNNLMTGGGVIDVTLYSGVDGDTAKFYYPADLGIRDGTKVRFENINTPESYAANVMPWGIPAKIYTTNELKNALKIQLQSLEGGELYDTFDRVLAWVWTDGNLLNFNIVRNGYSEIAFSSVDNMFYKDLSYTSWLYDAQLYAKKNGLGVWGAKDPYWDYDNNTIKDEYSHYVNGTV